MELFVALIATGLLIMLMILLYSAMKDGIFLLLYKAGLQQLFTSNETKEKIKEYLKDFIYYKSLSDEGKKNFINRLNIFKYNKDFIGAKGFVVTEEMRVLISACAVQLTFGLKKHKLENLESIIIFPDTFYLHKRGPEYKGATKLASMYLSWNDFKRGYENNNDQLNLGLHEMTHALKLSLKLGYRFDQLFADKIEYWDAMINEIKNSRKINSSSFLRPYSKTNSEEFFAVCVETFFETPKEFEKQLPEIYFMLVFLLNQNPANQSNDYKINENYFENKYTIPEAKDIKKSYRYNSSHWSMYLLVAGCLSGLPTILYLLNDFFLPVSAYVLGIFLFGTIGMLQKRYFQEQNILTGNYFIMYAYGGFGTTILVLLLWINFFIPVSNTRSEKHLINSYHAEYNYSKRGGKTFVGYQYDIEDDLQFNFKFLTLNDKPKKNENYIVFKYKYGCLGIKKLDNYYFSEN